MKKAIIVAVLLSSCASWAPTKNANIRAWASSKLSSCLFGAGNSMAYQHECMRESREFCKEHNLELDCGEGDLYTRVGK
jgi:hypothetical protein